jgi:hypothetical protein
MASCRVSQCCIRQGHLPALAYEQVGVHVQMADAEVSRIQVPRWGFGIEGLRNWGIEGLIEGGDSSIAHRVQCAGQRTTAPRKRAGGRRHGD